jgi:phage-related protein
MGRSILKQRIDFAGRFVEKYSDLFNLHMPKEITEIFVGIRDSVDNVTNRLSKATTKEHFMDICAEISGLVHKTEKYMDIIKQSRENFGIGDDIKSGIDSTIAPVKNILNDVVNSFNGLFIIVQGLPKKFEDGFNSVKSEVSTAVNQATGAITKIGDNIGTTVSEQTGKVATTISDFGKNALGSVDTFGKGAIKTVTEFGDTAIREVSKTTGAVTDTISGASRDVLNTANKVVSDVTGTVGKFADDSVKVVTDTANAVESTVTNFGKNALKEVTDTTGKIVGTVKTFTNDAIDTTTGIGNDIVGTVTDFADDAIKTVKTFGNDAIGTVTEIGTDVFDSVKGFGEKVIGTIKDVYESINFSDIFNWIKVNFMKLVEFVIATFEWMKDFFMNTLPTFISSAKEVIVTTKKNMKVAWPAVLILPPVIFLLQKIISGILFGTDIFPDLIIFGIIFILIGVQIYYDPEMLMNAVKLLLGNRVSMFLFNTTDTTDFVLDFQSKGIVDLQTGIMILTHFQKNWKIILQRLFGLVVTKLVVVNGGSVLLKGLALNNLSISVIISSVLVIVGSSYLAGDLKI